jgi:hypothetical protein
VSLRGANWTPPASGVRCFLRSELSDRDEWCGNCAKHIRRHFGGTEYRCDPREDGPAVPMAKVIDTAEVASLRADRDRLAAEVERLRTELHVALVDADRLRAILSLFGLNTKAPTDLLASAAVTLVEDQRGMNAQRLAALSEVERLTTERREMDPLFRSRAFYDFTQFAVMALADLAAPAAESRAPNFVALTLGIPTDLGVPFGNAEIHLVRPGGKTPSEMLAETRTERDAAIAEVKRLSRQWCGVCNHSLHEGKCLASDRDGEEFCDCTEHIAELPWLRSTLIDTRHERDAAIAARDSIASELVGNILPGEDLAACVRRIRDERDRFGDRLAAVNVERDSAVAERDELRAIVDPVRGRELIAGLQQARDSAVNDTAERIAAWLDAKSLEHGKHGHGLIEYLALHLRAGAWRGQNGGSNV